MADEDLYRQAIKGADRETERQKPFFLHLMTTSNHRPYTYPEGKIDIPSGTGRAGAVKYTDYAIGQFLRQAQQQEWFDHTIFVIVADHQAGSAGKRALPIERYHIPLWIYSPAQIPPAVVSALASQIDIAPTLLGILNMSYLSCFFGHDVLLAPPGRALIANYQNLGLYDGQQLAILKPQEKIALQQGFASQQIHEQVAGETIPLVQRDISYYQSAAYIYKNRINRWSSRHLVPIHTAATESPVP
jgi:phosphoglycerol transferase MdoB-like AlkP superfamily enzyme